MVPKDNTWIYEAFFSQISNTANHYQYLVILIISAGSFLLYKSNSTTVKVLSALSCLTAAANLIVGLFIYSAILNTVFDFTQSIDKPDLSDPFRCLFKTQLIVGIISFVFLLLANLAAMYSMRQDNKNEI